MNTKAALHRAIRAINEAVADEHNEHLLAALANPHASLAHVDDELIDAYMGDLRARLEAKQANAIAGNNDMYALLLTREQIQTGVDVVYGMGVVQNFH
jgi:hypothetical protein